jgi:hypothetical protein
MQWSKKSNRQLGIARKDVAIGGDPKFREMSHFLTSYTHQERLVGMHHGDVSPRKDRDHAPKGAPKLEERLAFFQTKRTFWGSACFEVSIISTLALPNGRKLRTKTALAKPTAIPKHPHSPPPDLFVFIFHIKMIVFGYASSQFLDTHISPYHNVGEKHIILVMLQHTHTHIYVYIYTYMYIYICMYIYIYMYI